MASEIVQKQRAFSSMFFRMKSGIEKIHGRYTADWNEKTALSDKKLLEEAENITRQVTQYGGIKNLLKYAELGMKTEEPDLFQLNENSVQNS